MPVTGVAVLAGGAGAAPRPPPKPAKHGAAESICSLPTGAGLEAGWQQEVQARHELPSGACGGHPGAGSGAGACLHLHPQPLHLPGEPQVLIPPPSILGQQHACPITHPPLRCSGRAGCPGDPGLSPQAPQLLQDAHNSSVLNNYVLGAYLRSGRVVGLSQPVEIQFWHDMVLDASNATCVFWQPEAGKCSTGSWSKEGCETTHREGTVICHCNHLTYFAVLLVHNTLSPAQLASLTYISTIGCSLSAAATLCTLLLCCFSRQWLRDNTTKIHMHLLAALLLLNCSFLLSTPLATSAEGLCRVTAALLHAGLLCALAWMAAEAFHLLLLLVKVYNVYIQHYLLKLCLFAWGLPTLAVVAVFVFRRDTYGYHAISTSEGYTNVTMCWLTSPPAHYATLCYAGLILLFNTLVLGSVVMILRRIQQQKRQARKDWVTVLGLTCLLGTTWGLAFFSFGVFLVPQLYLFTILNSLQGLFVCLWYVTVHRQSKLGTNSDTSR
uniref:Adhesion G protein-coupled receptor G5 n=1 Tax=Strix occidentalis caurina TaxID=311401 RepID=A0A8D0F1H6_STROC